MNSITETLVKDNSANPGPLGLMAFGLTTVLLNLHNAGFFPLDGMILSMGIFYGGLAQIIAGILESKKNNTFGMTAFISYGFFWISLVGIFVMPKLGWSNAASKEGITAFLSIWGVFTLLLFFITLKHSRALQFIFGSLALLFFLLAIGHQTENKGITQFAGFEGIICGASAIYTAIATLIQEAFQKEILPIGQPKP